MLQKYRKAELSARTRNIPRFVLLFLVAILCGQKALAATPELKPRVVILTDIAPGNIEPDDMESMVRLMTYADQLEIEALITTIGWNCDP